MEFTVTQEFIDQLREYIVAQNDEAILEGLGGLHAADISSVLHELDTQDCTYIVNQLEPSISAEILSNLDSEVRRKFLRNFTPEKIAVFLDTLDSDDAVDILQEQPIKIREEVIASLSDPDQAKNILDLLIYEDGTAGGLMAKELIRANINWSVQQTIEEIRRQAENVEKVYTVYVVDNNGMLKGRVSLKKIILAKDNKKIQDLYDEELKAVQTYWSEEEVAELMQKYDLESVPVVNVQGKLLGRITIDDVVDVITELAERERQLMAGISESVEEDDNVWMLTRARLPWLLIGMVGGIIGSRIIGVFEANLVLVPAMAFFIPLITATGGNVGIQSSSIVVQTLASNTNIIGGNFARFIKLFAVAFINGLVLSLVAILFNLIAGFDLRLSLVVSFSLLNVVILSSVFGTITPIILDKLGINPAVASGPFITTSNDLLGLAVYFTIAHILL